MADDKITVGIDLEDDLTPKINGVKKALDGLQTSQPGGWKIGDIGKGAHEAGEGVGFLAEQFKELGSGIGYTIGAWNLGFMIAEKAVEAVGAGVQKALSAEKAFTEQLNITVTSQKAQKRAFEEVKAAAFEAGMGVEEFQKFTYPAIKTLENLGQSETEAAHEAKVLGQYMQAFGVDMREVAAKTELGAASFNDLLKAGLALGPMFQQEALAWEKFEIAEAQFAPQLQRDRQLMNEYFQDTQRAAEAHGNFAQKIGVTTSVFADFQKAIQMGGLGMMPTMMHLQIPSQLAGLPGARQAFIELGRESMRVFNTGIEQISKETGLSMQAVRVGAKAGLPGFGEQDLLAAQKRAVEEKEIARHRGEETEDFTRKSAAEQERLKLNREVAGILKEQAGYEAFGVERMAAFNNYLKSTPGLIDANKNAFDKWALAAGDLAHALKESDHHLSEMSQKLHEVPITPAAATTWGPAAQAPTRGGGGGQEPATESTLSGVHAELKSLNQMLQGH